MDFEPDLCCPKCGNTMELLSDDEDGSLLRVCPVCATLAWNAPDGAVEIREPHEVTGEEKRMRIPRDGDQRSELMSITIPK